MIVPAQWRTRHVPVGRGVRSPETVSGSRLRMKQTPGHGADFVEETQGGLQAGGIDRTCLGEEAKVGVDFLRRAVGDAPVVHAVSACSAVTLREIRGDRRC